MMKKILLMTMAGVFLLAGCAKSTEPTTDAVMEETSDAAIEETADTQTEETSDATQEMKLQIKVNGEVLTATLEDNSSAQALIDLIGDGTLTLEMDDYSGFEKVGDLPESLPENNEELNTDAGDLILYQGKEFVIYYDQNSWSLTKLGHIDNISKEELQELLGDDSVTVELSMIGDEA